MKFFLCTNFLLKKLITLVISSFLLFLLTYSNNGFAIEKTAAEQENIQIYIDKPDLSSFKQMLKRRYIRALVVYSKTDFFFDKGRTKGIQIEYLQQYEKYLNKDIKKETQKVHIVPVPVPFSQLIPALLAGKGDIAASFLTITPQRNKKVLFATGGKRKVSELLVRHKNAPAITKIEKLSGKKVYLLRNSSYIEHLKKINQTFVAKNLAPIIIEEADQHLLTEDILELVNSGIKKYTIVDDYIAELWLKILPDIKVNKNFSISDKNTIGWAVRKNNKELQSSLNNFSQKVKKGTLLGNIIFKRYYKSTH